MNIIKKIHLWLSVPFGLIISITCFTGAMLVFEKEITESVYRQLYVVDVPLDTDSQPLAIDHLAEIVQASVDSGVAVTGVTVFDDPTRAYQVSLSKPHRASVYIDQYTGEIKGHNVRLPFFATMFRLHRWLLDTRPAEGIFWGKTIVGISTLLFVIILITGLIVWWPRSRKMLSNRLTIKTNRGARRFWYDLHVVGGFYALVLLLVMSLTGLTWSFPWYRDAFYAMFGVEKQVAVQHINDSPTRKAERKAENLFLNWQLAYDNVASVATDYSKISVRRGEVSVSLAGLGNQRASDKYKFNPRTGEVIEVEYYADAPRRTKVSGWIYSVHVGSFGGIVTRILAFLAALFGASLPLTGYYLWIKRVYKRKRD